jgi:uncharacterized protein (TIRG00374 family)
MAEEELDSREIEQDDSEETQEIEQAGSRLLSDKRRIASVFAAFLLLIVAIYVLLPKVVGIGDALQRLDHPSWPWIGIAVGFNAASFVAYAVTFRGLMSERASERVKQRLDLRTSYHVTMAGFAATTLFSAAGAGGIALTYWALRKAGMERRETAAREVAFLVLLYTVYVIATLVFAVLLRTGVLAGPAPVAVTVVPAVLAGTVLAFIGLLSMIPGDVDRRLGRFGERRRVGSFLARAAAAPATVSNGVRFALAHLRHPRRGGLALVGAIGYWAGEVGILWAAFHAFGGGVPIGVVILGFFVGMVANLLPSPAAGVGTLDAGLIGAFLVFDVPSGTVFPAVLAFRLVGFWLPIVPGVISYFRLRTRVNRWIATDDAEGYTIKSKASNSGAGAQAAGLSAEES